jgi:hypothetical protein
MFTTVLPTLLAAAALSTQTVNPSTAATIIAANAPAAETTAITTTVQKKHAARIPGTFDVTAESDVLAGAQALYVVRTGDGA